MSQFINNIRNWFAYRSLIKQTTEYENLQKIPEFLIKYPDKQQKLLWTAQAFVEYNAPWYALLICLGLIRANIPATIEILRALQLNNISSSHSYWTRLLKGSHSDTVCSLAFFVAKYGTQEELHAILKLLTKVQIIEYVKRVLTLLNQQNAQVLSLIKPVFSFPDKIRFWEGIDNQMLVSFVTFLYHYGNSADIIALYDTFNTHQKIRAINLLYHDHSVNCLSALKKVWWRIEEEVRTSFREKQEIEADVFTLTLADSVAIALGRCAAYDKDYHTFAHDYTSNAILKNLMELANSKIAEHNQFVEQYQSDLFSPQTDSNRGYRSHDYTKSSELSKKKKKILALRVEIRTIEEKIKDIESEQKQTFSPGFILWRVLMNPQGYPQIVKQGAAYGLFLLLVEGTLDRETKLEIVKLLSHMMTDEHAQEFSERIIRLLPDADMIELSEALQRGIEWMTQLIETFSKTIVIEEGSPNEEQKQLTYLQAIEQAFAQHRPAVINDFPQLQHIIELLCSLMPQALKFLTHYPLRLMSLDYHKKVFGQFSKIGCGIEYWTQFTPPKDIGEVHRRYIKLNDRSQPNSMGIYYQLFRHPILVLPVIYHEYLHYAGVTGNPDDGILNETEVLLRELIFARSLVAQMAPENINDIPHFEQSLIESMQQIEFESLIYQLLCDLEDDHTIAAICQYIIETYGKQLTEQEAGQFAQERIIQENVNIHIENETLTWDKHIVWPEIGSAGTEALAKKYFDILKNHRMVDHTITVKQRDAILHDPICQNALQMWRQYRNKPGALTRFNEFLQTKSYEPIEIIRLIVRHFDIAIEDRPSLLRMLFHIFNQAAN